MEYKSPKLFKGEKYIYLAMAYKLAKENGDSISIGDDNGMVGAQNYWRRFTIVQHKGRTILAEVRNKRNFAEFSRYFEVIDRGDKKPAIKEYINEDNENCSTHWVH